MKELDIVEYIREKAGKTGKYLKVGIGDDCAVLKIQDSGTLLWAADMLVEDTHFKLKKAGYYRVGRKAVAVNISDIAAMGGIPLFVTVSLGLPRGITTNSVRRLYDGIFDICGEYGMAVAGGDTNRSEKLVIDVSIIGKTLNNNFFTRSGARPGDLLLITGPVRDGKKHHLDFRPRLIEARTLLSGYRVNAMIDVSDGIALDVSRICAESGTGCVLYEDAIPLAKGLSPEDALYYGESYELLFAMTPRETRRLVASLKDGEKCPFFIIGEITRKSLGRKIVGKEGSVETLRAQGYSHFQA